MKHALLGHNVIGLVVGMFAGDKYYALAGDKLENHTNKEHFLVELNV